MYIYNRPSLPPCFLFFCKPVGFSPQHLVYLTHWEASLLRWTRKAQGMAQPFQHDCSSCDDGGTAVPRAAHLLPSASRRNAPGYPGVYGYKVQKQLPARDLYLAWEQTVLLVYDLDSHQKKGKSWSERLFQLLSLKPSDFIPPHGKHLWFYAEEFVHQFSTTQKKPRVFF